MTRTRRIQLFVLISYGLSTLIGLGLWLSGATYDGLVMMAIAALTMFTPTIAAVVVQKLSGESPLAPIGGRPRLSWWLLWGALISFGAAILVVVVTALFPGVGFSLGVDGLLENLAGRLTPEQLEQVRVQFESLPVSPLILAIPQVLIAGLTINAVFAFGEELGWRGLLHRELRHLGFWRSSAITGVLWGFWHAPIILNGHNYPNDRVAGVFLFVVVCVLLSPMHALAREKAKSVWAAATMHGTFNAAAGLSGLVTTGGNELLVGPAGLTGILALVVVNLVIFAYLRSRPLLDPVVQPAA